MDKENIFKMDLSEIDNTMDNVLKGTTPEKLSKELYGNKDIKENSNAADTNVATIEEDIKILEEFIDGLKQYNPKTGKDIKPTQFGEGQRYVYSNVYYAIDHILSDYKKVLKENEYMHNELDKQQTTINKYAKENEEYSKQLDLDYVDKNYISKKKIEDELEELKGKLEDISKRREKSKTKEEKSVLWCLEIRTDERIKTLHELLENYKMNPKQ